MKNYCLFYLPKTSDALSDVLTIYFGDNKIVTNRLDKGSYSLLYSNDEIIGYLLKDFSKICKIHVNGTIYLPNDNLLSVINSVLTNFKLDTLESKFSSGIVIGKIKSCDSKGKAYIYKIDIDEREIYSESSFKISLGTKVAVILNETYIYPGMKVTDYKISKEIVSGGRIASYEDLEMNEPDAYKCIEIDDDVLVGSDFFRMEKKIDA